MAKTAKIELKAFRAVSNAALAAKELPTRIKVLDWGSNETTDVPVTLNDQSVKAFDQNQKKIGRVQVPLDFRHNTVPGTEAYRADKEPRAIAAYGCARIIKGDGMYLEDLKWTPSGEKSARDFADLSPAPILKDGVVIGLHSVALTEAGAVTDLSFYSAVDSVEALLAKFSDETPKPTPMSAELIAFRTMLDLPETATLEQITAAFKAKLDAPAAITSALSAEAISKLIQDGIETKVTTFAADLKLIKDKAASDMAAAEKAQRDMLIAEASRDGKVIPLSADEVAGLPVTLLKSMIMNLKPSVPTSVRPMDLKPLSAEDMAKHREGAFDRGAATMNQYFTRAIRDRQALIQNQN